MLTKRAMSATVTRPEETNQARVPADPRAVKVVAKSIYRELVDSGFGEADVMSLAGELLSLVASEVREKRNDHS